MVEQVHFFHVVEIEQFLSQL